MTSKRRANPKRANLMELDRDDLCDRLLSRVTEKGTDREKVLKAISILEECYEMRLRDEGAPYVVHPLRVAIILIEEAGISGTEMVCAALLHDVFEDCPQVDHRVLESEFGAYVVRMVGCLTNEFKGQGLPKEEARGRYLDRLVQEEHDCVLIKLCDRLDNLRSVSSSNVPGKQDRMVQETHDYLLRPSVGASRPMETMLSLLRSQLDALESD
jgi:guanosine-3',5'-bis(diphosphate) 3'-pyrophosphohydrolase